MKGNANMLPNVILTRNNRPVTAYPTCGLGDELVLWWLGQAGFLLRYRDRTVIIDAYLSDFLSGKYAGRKYPHKRMMRPPIEPQMLTGIDACICSHSHSDHMDPGLLPILSANNPACRFIMPEAVRHVGIERKVPDTRITGMNAGSSLSLGDGITISAIPAAHEELRVDERGQQLFLGFILQFGDITVYHSGDSVPYAGLDEYLNNFSIDLLLLPVNGRDPALAAEGIAGNFTINEALQVMANHDILLMIAHHFGMFDFNTVDPDALQRYIDAQGLGNQVFPAQEQIEYCLKR